MPTEPLTDAEIAELRRVCAANTDRGSCYEECPGWELIHDGRLARLLDEIEELREYRREMMER